MPADPNAPWLAIYITVFALGTIGLIALVDTELTNSINEYNLVVEQYYQGKEIELPAGFGLSYNLTSDGCHVFGGQGGLFAFKLCGVQTRVEDRCVFFFDARTNTTETICQYSSALIPGPQGATGPRGVNGTQGIQGLNGTQGYQGAQGIQGVQGDTGERGYNGTKGLAGEKGDRGINGTQGDVGDQGPIGDVGDQGAQGIQGEQGDQGPTGPPGNSTMGVNGTKGDTGPQGPDGPQGIQGVTGADGPEGIRGINGTKGLQGATGAKGATGDVGDKGATGATGAAGATGATGPQGPQGPQGPTGATGNTGLTGPRGNDAQPSLVDRVIMDSSLSRTAVEVTGGSTTVRLAVYEDNGYYGDGSSGSLTLFGTFDSRRTNEHQFQNLKMVGTARFATLALHIYVNDTLDLSESTVDGAILPLLWNENVPGGATGSGNHFPTSTGLKSDSTLYSDSAMETLSTFAGAFSASTTTTTPLADSACQYGAIASFAQNPTCSGLQAVAGRSVATSPAPPTHTSTRSMSASRLLWSGIADTSIAPPFITYSTHGHGYAGQSAQFSTSANAGAGGFGGMGGSFLFIRARKIILPNSPVSPFISPGSQGSHGGPASTSTSAGAGGGGSGGAGGTVVLSYNELVGNMLAPLIRVDGGYGGDGGRGFGTTDGYATGGGGGSGGTCGKYTVYDTGRGITMFGPTTVFGMNVGPSISGLEYGSSGVRGCRMHWPFNYQTIVSEINAVEFTAVTTTHNTLGACTRLSRDGLLLYTTITPLGASGTLIASKILVYRQTSPGKWDFVFQYTPTTTSATGDLGVYNACDLTPDGTRFAVFYRENAGTSYSFITLLKTGYSTWTATENPGSSAPGNTITQGTAFLSISEDGNTVVMRTRATSDQFRKYTLSAGSWSLSSGAGNTGACSSGTGEGPVYVAKNASYILVGMLRSGVYGFCVLDSSFNPQAFYSPLNATAQEGGSLFVTGITASDDGNVVYLVTTNTLGRSMINMFVTQTSGGAYVPVGTGVYMATDNTATAISTFSSTSISCTPDGRVVFFGSRIASTPMGQTFGFRRIGDRLRPFANPLSSKAGLHSAANFGCSVSVSADGLQVASSSCPAFSGSTRTQQRIFVFRYQDAVDGTPPRAFSSGFVLRARVNATWSSRVTVSANGWAVSSGQSVLFRRRHGTTDHQFVYPSDSGVTAFTDRPVTLLDHGGTASLNIGQLGTGGGLTLGMNFTSCIWSACTTTFNTITTLSSTTEPYSACATRNLDFVYVSKGTLLYLLMGRTTTLTQVGNVTLASNANARHRAYLGCSTAGEIVAVLRPSPLAVWVYTLKQFADTTAMGSTPVTLSPLDNSDAAVGTHLSVSADGSTIVAASVTNLWVFRRSGGTWAQVGSRHTIDSIELAAVHLNGKYLWALSIFELRLYHWKDGAYKIYQGGIGNFPTGNALSLSASHNGSVCAVMYFNSSTSETLAQVFAISQLPITRTELGDPVKRLPKELVLTRASGAPPRAMFATALKMSRDGNWLAFNWYSYATSQGAIGVFHRESATRSYLATNEILGDATGNAIGHSLCFAESGTSGIVMFDRRLGGDIRAWTFSSASRRLTLAHTLSAAISTTGASVTGESNAMLVCGSDDSGATFFLQSGRVGTSLNSLTAYNYQIGVGFTANPTADISIPAGVEATTSSWGSALAMSDNALVLVVYARTTSTGQGDDGYFVYRRSDDLDTWDTHLQILRPLGYAQPGTLNPPSINRDGSIITFVSKTGGATSDSVSVFVYQWFSDAIKYVLVSVPAPFTEQIHTANVAVNTPAQPQQVEVSADADRLFFSFPQLTGATTGANLFYHRRVAGQTDYYTIDGTQHVGPTMTASSPARHSMAMSADGETMVSTDAVASTTDTRVNLLEVDRL